MKVVLESLELNPDADANPTSNLTHSPDPDPYPIPAETVTDEELAAARDCPAGAQWLGEEVASSERPELATANIVVSGSRGLPKICSHRSTMKSRVRPLQPCLPYGARDLENKPGDDFAGSGQGGVKTLLAMPCTRAQDQAWIVCRP